MTDAEKTELRQAIELLSDTPNYHLSGGAGGTKEERSHAIDLIMGHLTDNIEAVANAEMVHARIDRLERATRELIQAITIVESTMPYDEWDDRNKQIYECAERAKQILQGVTKS